MKYSYEYKKKCVELYRQGKWPETPDGVNENAFMIQFGFGFVQKMLVVKKHYDIKIKTKYGQQKKSMS